MNHTQNENAEKLWFLKPILSFKEGCWFTDLSPSRMYKLTAAGEVPHYKPNGKKIYFRTEELKQWLLRNRSSSNAEIEREATKMAML